MPILKNMFNEIISCVRKFQSFISDMVSKRPWLKNIPVIFSLSILILVLYAFSPLFIELSKDFMKNFEALLVFYLVTFSYALYVFYGIIRIISETYHVNWWNKNKWTIHTVYFMFCIFVLGTVFITVMFGKPQLELVLREAVNGTVAGNIACIDNSGYLIVGNEISCTTEPRLSNLLVFISFDFLNGTHTITHGQSNLTLTASSNLRRIGFNIRGVDDNNQNRSFVTSNDFNFLSEDEAKERKDNFITFFLALLGIILFTVPAAMVNLKQLAES